MFKVNRSFFQKISKDKEEEIKKFIKMKYDANENTDFFGIGGDQGGAADFAEFLMSRGISGKETIDKLIGLITKDQLHPLQCIRISQIINDPDEELDNSEKEILLNQTLKITKIVANS